ncbi:Shedu immune nuclease family protein [Nonomuraea wenchangensis]|uniref:Shedu immune nuclease family protein n=1 Tax=Nonomuraea wenchangensis TaxID=568860 RepID=UPI00384CA41F
MAWLDGLRRAPTREEFDADPTTLEAYLESLAIFDDYCRNLHSEQDPDLLEEILLDERRTVGTEWLDYAALAAAGILLRGPVGVEQLARIAKISTSSMWQSRSVETLWKAARGLDVPQNDYVSRKNLQSPYPISDATRVAARTALDDLIIESQSDMHLFKLMLGIAHMETLGQRSDPGSNHVPASFARHFIGVFEHASINLTSRAIDKFELMVAADLPEESYQQFLKEHPVLLDPLAAEVIQKHKLGTEFVTDFVIRRHDHRYVVVEIEKPQDAIVTSSGNLSALFSHALGQVLDFQDWMANNVAYAQKNLPRIEEPQGLLIMGRRSDMTDSQIRKLRRWCTNSKSIEVMTFDDLVTRGRQLLASLRTHRA